MSTVPGTEKARRPICFIETPWVCRYACMRRGALAGSNLSFPSSDAFCQITAVGAGGSRLMVVPSTSRNLVRVPPMSMASTL
eukprot:scaffold103793_cov65-Phaeocystis_antarctica.AAC.9